MDKDEIEVNRILKEKDLYKVLKVERSATEAEIKRNYRKLAQLVHPDRNHSENATSAFQKVSHAYQTLSNEEKRRLYDQYGDQPPEQLQQHRRAQQQYYYNDEITPEDLFSFFFGGPAMAAGMNRQRRYNREQYRQQNQNQEVGAGSLIGRLIPILLFVVMMLMNSGIFDLGSLLESNPVNRQNLKGILTFEIDPSAGQQIERRSVKYKVKYYLPQWWASSQRGDRIRQALRKVDAYADEAWVEELQIRCELEKNQIGKEGPKCAAMKKVIG